MARHQGTGRAPGPPMHLCAAAQQCVGTAGGKRERLLDQRLGRRLGREQGETGGGRERRRVAHNSARAPTKSDTTQLPGGCTWIGWPCPGPRLRAAAGGQAGLRMPCKQKTGEQSSAPHPPKKKRGTAQLRSWLHPHNTAAWQLPLVVDAGRECCQEHPQTSAAPYAFIREQRCLRHSCVAARLAVQRASSVENMQRGPAGRDLPCRAPGPRPIAQPAPRCCVKRPLPSPRGAVPPPTCHRPKAGAGLMQWRGRRRRAIRCTPPSGLATFRARLMHWRWLCRLAPQRRPNRRQAAAVARLMQWRWRCRPGP